MRWCARCAAELEGSNAAGEERPTDEERDDDDRR
jgi:hypothetical protein